MIKPGFRPFLCLFALLTATYAPVQGQTASLVADLQPPVDGSGFSTQPMSLTPLGDKVVFFDASGTLRVSDGTALGSEALAQVCPRSGCGSLKPSFLDGGRLLYFQGGDGFFSSLWRTDGTRLGTFPLGVETTGAAVVAGDRVYWLQCAPAGHCSVSTGDGTIGGARRLTEPSRLAGRDGAAGRLAGPGHPLAQSARRPDLLYG